MEKTSRRLFLASSPAALAIFGALGVAAAEHAPSTMQMLSKEFERLWAIERHAGALGTDDELDAATTATSEAVDRILAVPAKTIDDFKVKGRALCWCYGADDVEEFFEDIPNATDTKLVRSIIRDLLAV